MSNEADLVALEISAILRSTQPCCCLHISESNGRPVPRWYCCTTMVPPWHVLERTITVEQDIDSVSELPQVVSETRDLLLNFQDVLPNMWVRDTLYMAFRENPANTCRAERHHARHLQQRDEFRALEMVQPRKVFPRHRS